MDRFFNENRKLSNKVMNQHVLYLLQSLLALFVNFYFIFLGFVLFPGNFRYLVIVSFNFTVYDIIYLKNKK